MNAGFAVGVVALLFVGSGAVLAMLGGVLVFADRTVLRNELTGENESRPGPRLVKLGLTFLFGGSAFMVIVAVLSRLIG